GRAGRRDDRRDRPCERRGRDDHLLGGHGAGRRDHRGRRGEVGPPGGGGGGQRAPGDPLHRVGRGRSAQPGGDLRAGGRGLPRDHAPVGPQAAHDLAGVRELHGGGRLHPGHVRLRGDGGRGGHDVPGRPAAGAGGAGGGG